MKTVTLEEVVKDIYDVLLEDGGEFVEEIANRVLFSEVSYKGDSLFEYKQKKDQSMLFVNINDGNNQFTVIAQDNQAVWFIYTAFRKLYRTDGIAAWVSIVDSKGGHYYPENGTITPVKGLRGFKSPLNEYSEKELKHTQQKGYQIDG